MDNNTPAGESYPWARHLSWHGAPAEQFPSPAGPIVYEGFVPDEPQASDVQVSSYPEIQDYHLGQENFLHQSSSQHQYQGHLEDDTNTQKARLDPFGNSSGLVASTSNHIDQGGNGSCYDIEDEGIEAENYGIDAIDVTLLGIPETVTDKRPKRTRTIPTKTAVASLPKRRARKPEPAPRGRKKGVKVGPRDVLDPGEEFNNLHKEATDAFIDRQDYDGALELILKAISINPEIHSAHVLLSEIYFTLHDEERGVAALFSGAHASPNDPAVWHQLADVCLQRSSLDRSTMLRQAAYCFQRLLQINQQDHDARFQKAAISRELGHHAKALSDLEFLLQKMPHNSSLLRQIAEICLDINDVGRAIRFYDNALEHQKFHGHTDEDVFSWTDLIMYVDLVARSDGTSHAVQVLKDSARWLIGRGDESYWEDFSADDREWDAEDYPRRTEVPAFEPGAYPIESYGLGLPLELRVKLGELRLKEANRDEALTHFEWLTPEDRTDEAVIHDYSDLVLQVADNLREVKEYEQALRYYEALHSINACEDLEFWLGLGACSYVCDKKEQALYCYEEAKSVDPTSGEARTQLSKLYAERGDREKALLLARSAITLFESQIPKTERRKYERKDLREARKLAQKAYKDAYRLPAPDDRTENASQHLSSRRIRIRARDTLTSVFRKISAKVDSVQQETDNGEDSPAASDATMLQTESDARGEVVTQRPSLKKATKKARGIPDRYEIVRQLYSTLSSVTEAMRGGDDVARNVWIDCAEALIDEFRKQKVFYPAERHAKFQGFDRSQRRLEMTAENDGRSQPDADVPLPSVESNVPVAYCDITFATWLDIFLEQAMLLSTLHDDVTECYAIISAALDCNVWYHDTSSIFRIYACWLACALALRDENTLFNTVIRWFMREFSFCTDTFRLFGAFNYLFPYPNDKGGKQGQMNNAVFRLGPNQKFMFRQIIAIDSQLPASYGNDQPDGPVPDFMRKSDSDTVRFPDEILQGNDFDSVHQRARSNTSNPSEDGVPELGSQNITGDNRMTDRRTFTPKELDVVLLTLYGQILYAGNSFPNALSYFFRAYNVDPKNPVLLLTIALCYIHQMLKRQNENRHMYLLQGWSFFEQYATVKLEKAREQEKEGCLGSVAAVMREIEFNRARCWQMLGMNDLAIRSYGRVLDIKPVKNEDAMDVDVDVDVTTETGTKQEEEYSMEAAYAMTCMYVMSGNLGMAREMTEKYLVC